MKILNPIKALITIFILVIFNYSGNAIVRYVKPTASGSGNGTSWANASADLQAMINASASGDEVWVAAGEYYPTRDYTGNSSPTDPRTKTFFLKSGVNVYGSFLGNETSISSRNISTNRTTLNGNIGQPNIVTDNCYHVVMMILASGNIPGCVLDGFSIREGLANSGAYVYINGRGVNNYYGGGIMAIGGTGSTFRNLSIFNNRASAYGGGLYYSEGVYKIENDSIYNNMGDAGGGVCSTSSTDSLINNVIYSNSAGSAGGLRISSQTVFGGNVVHSNYAYYGAGMEVNRNNFVAYNNYIYSNTARLQGGGILIDGEGFKIYNNVFFRNNVIEGGGAGIFLDGGSGNITSNTFFENTIYGTYGSALWLVFGSAVVTNNILWNNNSRYDVYVSISPLFPVVAVGNIIQSSGLDPLFVDPTKPLGADNIPGTADDGLRLTICSPAVNAGATLNPALPKDILGNSRVGNYDIGAYEFQGVGPVHADTIKGDSAVCLNGTIVLTNSVQGGVWSTSDSTKMTVSASGVVTGKSLGSANIIYTTDNTGCPSSITQKKIYVRTFMTLNAIAGPDSLCTLQTIQLTNDTPEGLWSSTDTNIAKVSQTGLVTAVSTGNVTIKYRVGAQGCFSEVSKNIFVKQTQALLPISGPAQLCITDSALYTSSPAGGLWSTDNNNVATISQGGWMKPIGYNSLYVKYTFITPLGCKSEVQKSVSIFRVLNSASEPITGPDSLCEGEEIRLKHNQEFYSLAATWASSDTTIAKVRIVYAGWGNKAEGIITGAAKGTATITYSLAHVCPLVLTKEVTVGETPVVSPISGGTSVCANSMMQLADTLNGGVWSTYSNGLRSSIDTNGLVSGLNAGKDTVRYIVTTDFGCADTADLPIIINPIPVVNSVQGVDTMCMNEEMLFTNTTKNGWWETSDSKLALVDTAGLVKGVASGNVAISYSVSNQFGCTTTREKDVVINVIPLPSAIVGSTALCIGSEYMYMNNTPGGVWSTFSNGGVSTILPNGKLFASVVGKDTVVYTVGNSFGCYSSSFRAVELFSPVAIDIDGPKSVCAGEQITLGHKISGGAWSNVTPLLGGINKMGLYASKTHGTDTVYYEYLSNGCPIAVNMPVVVNKLPDTSMLTGNPAICVSEVMVVTPSAGGGVWSSNNSGVAGVSSSGRVQGITEGFAMLNYTLTNSAGCSSTSMFPVMVNVADASVGQNGVVLSALVNSNGATYQWVECGDKYTPIPNADSASFTATENGKYALIVSRNGCFDTSSCLEVVGLEPENPTEDVLVYPNPTSDKFTVWVKDKIPNGIKILDGLGRAIMDIKPESRITKFETSSFSPGVYNVYIDLGGEMVVRKLVVSKR